MRPPSLCLYPDFVSDIQKTLKIGKEASYNRVVVPITNREHEKDGDDRRKAFTRSDLLLDADAWRENTILKMSEFNECDSCDEKISKKSIQNLKLEIDWAKHQNSENAIVLVSLKTDPCANLARQFLNKFEQIGLVMAEMPMVDKSYFTQMYAKASEQIALSTASANIWHRWNQFRFTVDFNPQFKVSCVGFVWLIDQMNAFAYYIVVLCLTGRT